VLLFLNLMETVSNKVSVTQKPSWSQIFRGERITLTCEVQGGEGVQWEYEWRTPQSQTFRTKQKDWTITASISGDYSCKSRPTDDSYSATNWSEALRLSFLDAVLTFEPWSTFFIGESLTFKCDMKEGRTDDWKYTLKKSDRTLYSDVTQQDFKIDFMYERDGGDFQCCGLRKGSDYKKCSNRVSIRVSAHKPKAELKITKSPVEGRVTLSCSVKPSSSGWSFFWFRGEKPSKLLRTQDADFLSNGQIRVLQGGVHRCRGGRGEPVYHTEFSDPVTTNGAVLTFEPKWSTFFVGESLTFKCDMEEGRTDDWKYTLKRSDWTPYSDVTQQDFQLYPLNNSHSGDYQCCGLKNGSDYTKCSNRVSIRVSGNFLVSSFASPLNLMVCLYHESHPSPHPPRAEAESLTLLKNSSHATVKNSSHATVKNSSHASVKNSSHIAVKRLHSRHCRELRSRHCKISVFTLVYKLLSSCTPFSPPGSAGFFKIKSVNLRFQLPASSFRVAASGSALI
uniref:Ig-like domain-containing protein n=1 Tax=Oryzias latipes TaxID=8090 RepID=H2MYX9_ORYLA